MKINGEMHYHPQRPEMVACAISPDFALGPHVAALELNFSNGAMMPPKFQGRAFVGEDGNWDRTSLTAIKLFYVHSLLASPTASRFRS